MTNSQSRKLESGPGDCRTGSLATADLRETAAGASVLVLIPGKSVDDTFDDGSPVVDIWKGR
jgi:hypothetical protein